MPELPIRRREYPISTEEYDVNVYPGFRTAPAPYYPSPIPETLEEPLPTSRELPPINFTPGVSATPVRPSPSEEYTSSLGDMPRREDYSPSILRKILAIAGGASTGYLRSREDPSGGFQAASEATTNILEQPYRRALEKYGMDVGVAKERVEESRRQSKEGREQQSLGLEERKVGAGERRIGMEEEALPSEISLREAQAEKLRRPEVRQPTAFESQMAIFQELQKTPEGQALWDKFSRSGEESIEEWGRKQDRLQQDRIRLAREQSGLRRQEEALKPRKIEKPEKTEFEVLDAASDRVAKTAQFSRFFETVGKEGIPVLKDDETLIEENGWTTPQLEENMRRLDEAIQAEYNRITRIGGGGEQYEIEKVEEGK